MKLTLILGVLLALATAGFFWQTHQRGKEDVRLETLEAGRQDDRKVMTELQALSADVRTVLAEVRATEQQRQAQGEIRRENIRNATKNDTCANTVVPAAVSDSLQRRTAAAAREDRVRTRTGKPDGGNPRP